jgi:hypothetical protein
MCKQFLVIVLGPVMLSYRALNNEDQILVTCNFPIDKQSGNFSDSEKFPTHKQSGNFSDSEKFPIHVESGNFSDSEKFPIHVESGNFSDSEKFPIVKTYPIIIF